MLFLRKERERKKWCLRGWLLIRWAINKKGDGNKTWCPYRETKKCRDVYTSLALGFGVLKKLVVVRRKGLPLKRDMNAVWQIRAQRKTWKLLCLHLYNDGCKQIFPNQTKQFRRIKRSELSRVCATRSLPSNASWNSAPELINLEQRGLKVAGKELALPGILLLVTWVDHVASFVPRG